eukprot:jgi/Psemu1/286209/fgenesh1_pg.124_\
MSGLLEQYEETTARSTNGAVANRVLVFPDAARSDLSRTLNDSNGKVTTSKEMIGRSGRKQLSPIEESWSTTTTRPIEHKKDDGNHGAKESKPDQVMTGNTYPATTITGTNTNKARERKHRSSLETPLPKLDLDQFDPTPTIARSGSTHLIAIRSSKNNASSKPDRTSTPNSVQSQSEHIEAWFTPALLGMDNNHPDSVPAQESVPTTHDPIHEDVAVLRFGSNRNTRRPDTLLSGHAKPRVAPTTTPPIGGAKAKGKTHHGGRKPTKRSSLDPYDDDEWSPLAQHQSLGANRFDPGARDSPNETGSTRLPGGNLFGTASSFRGSNSNINSNINTRSSETTANEPSIPREIHCTPRGSTTEDFPPGQAARSKGNYYMANPSREHSIDAVVPKQNSNSKNSYSPEAMHFEILGSGGKSQAQNDREPSPRSLDRIEKEASRVSSPTFSGNGSSDHAVTGTVDTEMEVASEAHNGAVEAILDRKLGGSFPSSATEDSNTQNGKPILRYSRSPREHRKDVDALTEVDSEHEFDAGDDSMSVESEASPRSTIAPSFDMDQLDGIESSEETQSETNESEQEQALAIAATTRSREKYSNSEHKRRNRNHGSANSKEVERPGGRSISGKIEANSVGELRGSNETESVARAPTSRKGPKREAVSVGVLRSAKATKSMNKKPIQDTAMDFEEGFADAMIEEDETESMGASFALAEGYSDDDNSDDESTSVESLGHRHPESPNNYLAPDDDISDVISDGNRSDVEPRTIQTPNSHIEDRSQGEKFDSPRSYATSIASSRRNLGQYDTNDVDSESGASEESSVQPTTLKNNASQYLSQQAEESSIATTASPVGADSPQSSLGSRRKMSWRVLNPPHPICSLQRLDEIVREEQQKAKQAKKRRQSKRKKPATRRRRQPKKRGRR